MLQVGALAAIEPEDQSYPSASPLDPLYPCRTRAPIGAPLDGIATPFLWSRLRSPLARALDVTWRALGLQGGARPASWVSIHFGRIALDAHAWERLHALWAGLEPDASLIPPPGRPLERLPDRVERVRASLRRGKLVARIERARHAADQALLRARGRDPRNLDAAEVALGPLDEASWTEALLPWIFAQLDGAPPEPARDRVQIGVVLEQRFSTELGRRLVRDGLLRSPVDASYLTQDERVAAVQAPSEAWAQRAESRAARVARFGEVSVPARFWGRANALESD